MSDNFFPDEVNVESTSRYTKLNQGKTQLRILSAPLFFNETWNTDGSGKRIPARLPLTEKFQPQDLGPDGFKTCMAVKVYNHNEGSIQIWQVTQKTILKAIKEYSQNPLYGRPQNYDLVISKQGQAMTTKYSVIANPPAPLNEAIAKLDAESPVQLENLLVNADPFKVEEKTFEQSIA